MAILIDPPAWPAHGTLWSHLVSDSDTAELHAFAARMGLPRRSFDLDHYDVSAARYEQALALGAIAVAGRDVVARLQASGLRVRQVDRATVTPVRRLAYLREEWLRLGSAFAVPPSDWAPLGDDLIARWTEPHRRYHDDRHLEDVLLALDHLGVCGERISPDALLAAWFHDAVYDGVPGDDERNSAELAARELRAQGLAPEVIARVQEAILATDPATAEAGIGAVTASPARAIAQLRDADLSIFAAPPGRYAEYAAAIRAEYARVPDADFAAARARILRGFLDRPSIYTTDAARGLWESRARAQVADEIAELERAAR